jgi:hypothetical protein
VSYATAQLHTYKPHILCGPKQGYVAVHPIL